MVRLNSKLTMLVLVIVSGESFGAVTPAVMQMGAPAARPPLRSQVVQPPDSLNPGGVVISTPKTMPTPTPVPSKPQPKAASQGQPQNMPASGSAGPSSNDSNPVKKPFHIHFSKKKMGRPAFIVRTSSPYAEVILYTGRCPKNMVPEFQQMAIDRGILTKKNHALHYAVTSTEDGGRTTGCWFTDRSSGTVRAMMANGQGEEFAREQLDYAR